MTLAERVQRICAWLLEAGLTEEQALARVDGPAELKCGWRRNSDGFTVDIGDDVTWDVGHGVAAALEEKPVLVKHVAVLTGNAGGLALPMWTSHVVCTQAVVD
jgi:hypothetical protein